MLAPLQVDEFRFFGMKLLLLFDRNNKILRSQITEVIVDVFTYHNAVTSLCTAMIMNDIMQYECISVASHSFIQSSY